MLLLSFFCGVWAVVSATPAKTPRWVRASERALDKVCGAQKSDFEKLSRDLVAAGREACERMPYRDQWCVDAWDNAQVNLRSFGHPQGMVYVGKGGFVYLPIPKVATTTGRKWAAAAYAEDPSGFLRTIPSSRKPLADRLDGAALYRDLPSSVKAKGGFTFVRDPVDRFTSGWRELELYEIGPPERRGWGKRVLRAQPFYNLTKEARLVKAVRSLACLRDWNEHLTPQAYFIPDNNFKIYPVKDLPLVLPDIAQRANLSRATATRISSTKSNPSKGWPQPEDLLPALSDNLKPPTRFVWCWIYAVDYAKFQDFFQPPSFCDQAYAALFRGLA